MSRHSRPPKHAIPRPILRFKHRPRVEFARLGSTLPENYEDEEQQWIRGFCMLRCYRSDALVLHIGDVGGPGVHMPLYSCFTCYQEVMLLLTTWTRVRDGLAPSRAIRDLHDRFRRRSELASPR